MQITEPSRQIDVLHTTDVLVVGMHPRQRSLALVRIIDAERVTWPEAFQFEQHSEVVGPLGPVASGRRGHDPRYGPSI